MQTLNRIKSIKQRKTRLAFLITKKLKNSLTEGLKLQKKLLHALNNSKILKKKEEIFKLPANFLHFE